MRGFFSSAAAAASSAFCLRLTTASAISVRSVERLERTSVYGGVYVCECVNLGQVIFVLFSALECTQTRISNLSVARTMINWPSGHQGSQRNRNAHEKLLPQREIQIEEKKLPSFRVYDDESPFWLRYSWYVWCFGFGFLFLFFFFVFFSCVYVCECLWKSTGNMHRFSLIINNNNNNHKIISLFKLIEKKTHSTFRFYLSCFEWRWLETLSLGRCVSECHRASAADWPKQGWMLPPAVLSKRSIKMSVSKMCLNPISLYISRVALGK